MTYLLLYCFVVFSLGVTADRVILAMEEAKDHCGEQTEMHQTSIEQAQNGQFSDNKKLKDYYDCYGRRVGYIKEVSTNLIGNHKIQITIIDRNALRDWLVDKLQYDSKTTDHVLASCGLGNDYSYDNYFQPIKCLSENKLPVDVVSANYVDRSAEEMHDYQDHCQEKIQVDQNSIAKAQNGTIDNSGNLLGMYYACYSLLVGFLTAWSEFDFYSLEGWLKNVLNHDSDKVEFAIHKCYKIIVEDNDGAIKQLLKIVKCFADEHVPIDVMANH